MVQKIPLHQLPEDFEYRLLQSIQHYDYTIFLNPNHFDYYPCSPFKKIIAWANQSQSFKTNTRKAFQNLSLFSPHQWKFGYLSYDLKNEIEILNSSNISTKGFDEAFFFTPETMVVWNDNYIEVTSSQEGINWEKLFLGLPTFSRSPVNPSKITLQAHTPKAKYLKNVEAIKAHIREGDVYELNYCMEFYAQGAILNPLQAYRALNERSPMPFSVFLKQEEKYILCASPERFLKKQSNQLISQPIKGTIARSKDPIKDTLLKEQLRNSEKERAENMMIVDLVRNDLARSAIIGSTQVDEMFGIYSFAQVHQMISTIKADLRPGVEAMEALKMAFPMGSMTGAPKIRAMELIDFFEDTRREVFSGAIGYITPEEDFDFNVVIRSIFYNAKTNHLSFQTGSAITYDSDAEAEYQECLLKGKAIRETLLA